MSQDPRIAREARFWSDRAGGRDAEALATEDRTLASEPLFRYLEAQVVAAAPAHLLDVGCGSAVGTARLAPAAGRTIGIDVAHGSLAQGRSYLEARRCSNVELVETPVETLPFGDASFDLITGYFVLHHLSDLAAGAHELRRVLKPGGRAFFIETWGANPVLRAARALAGPLGLRQGTDDEEPLGEAELGTIAGAFARVDRHFPSLDLTKFAHLPLLKLVARHGPDSAAARLVARVWPWPVQVDAWLHSNFSEVRTLGWHVALELS